MVATMRRNLYFNYTMKGMSVMTQAPTQGHNFVWPESVRDRLCPEAKELTDWMPWTRWNY